MTDPANVPSVEIGGRLFLVPEYPAWAQRRVTPALYKLSQGTDLEDPESFGRMLDTVFMALTTMTVDGKPPSEDRPERKPLNEISKEDFECLPIRSLDLALEVIPLLLRQAGMVKAGTVTGKGGAEAPAPETPLPGPSTLTT